MKKSILAILCIALLSLCFTPKVSAQYTLILNGQNGQGIITGAKFSDTSSSQLEFKFISQVNSVRIDWRDSNGGIVYSEPITTYPAFGSNEEVAAFYLTTYEFTITATYYGPNPDPMGPPISQVETRYYKIAY